MTLQNVTGAHKEMSSIRLSNDLKSKLAKIGAKLTLEDGEMRTMEDIIKILYEVYEKQEKVKK